MFPIIYAKLSNMKIACFGYDFFYACLETLIKKGHHIYKIFTFKCDNKYNFNTRISAKAKEINAYLQFEKVKIQDIEKLTDEGCELIISAGYQYKIPILNKNMPYAINIHPTLLPEGKGPWPLPWIILKNLKKSGVTIHKLVEKLDSGDILLQREFTVTIRDDLETISCKSQMLAVELLDELINNFKDYWVNAIPQKSEGSYWKIPNNDYRTLKWSDDIKIIDRVARSFGKFDSFAIFDNKEWIVKDINIWKEKHNFTFGTVVHRTNKEVVIAARGGFVCLRFFEIDPDFLGEK